MNLPRSHRNTEKSEKAEKVEKVEKVDGEKTGVSLNLLALSHLCLCACGGKQEKAMNRLLQTLLTSALLLVITAVAQAQWVVAFQDKSKRDLNGVFFMDGRYGWVIGDRGIIH